MNADKREALRLKCKSDVRNVMLRTEELLDLLDDSAALGRVKQLRDDEMEFNRDEDDCIISIGELVEAIGRE